MTLEVRWLDHQLLYQFGKKLAFIDLASRMGNIGILWSGQDGQTVRGEGGMVEPMLGGAGSGTAPLYIEVLWVTGSGSCHHFHWRCRGQGVFMSLQEQKNAVQKSEVQDGTR